MADADCSANSQHKGDRMSNDSAAALEAAKKELRSRRFNAAIVQLTEAIAFDQNNADLFECLATAYFLRGDLEKALDAFQKVTKLKPTLARSWINIGAVQNRLGNFQEAVAALRKGVQRDRRSAEGQYNLGIAQKGLNQLAMAATAYKQAIRLEPGMAEAHQNLGNVYLEMNNNRQAINCFRKALELRPDFERARKSLAIAENAISGDRIADNPFGRLVTKEDMASQKATASFRELTAEERAEDRRLIRSHTSVARKRAGELSEHLRSKLEASLLALSRAMQVTGSGKTDLAKGYDELQTARSELSEIETQLAESMDLLRKHDRDIR